MKLNTLLLLSLAATSLRAAPEFKWSTREIGQITIGYGLQLADVNGDGKTDIVLADKKTIQWYENPSWEKHIIASDLTERDNVCIAARDINGDGQINAANELFGSATRLNNGSNAKDGYAALADLDSNHDGVINAFDELFNELQTWQDRISDAIVQEGELTYLKDSNVAELNLLASDTNEWQNDNLIGKQSQWTDSSGDSHQMADVWLNFTEQDDAALSQFSIELSSHSNSVELLFSQQISQTQTAPAFTSTNSSKLIHSVIENTPANVEVLDTSANDDALRNSSIVL